MVITAYRGKSHIMSRKWSLKYIICMLQNMSCLPSMTWICTKSNYQHSGIKLRSETCMELHNILEEKVTMWTTLEYNFMVVSLITHCGCDWFPPFIFPLRTLQYHTSYLSPLIMDQMVHVNRIDQCKFSYLPLTTFSVHLKCQTSHH